MNTNCNTKFLLQYRDQLLTEAAELTKPFEEKLKELKSSLHEAKILANQKKKLANEILESISAKELDEFAAMQKTLSEWSYSSNEKE